MSLLHLVGEPVTLSWSAAGESAELAIVEPDGLAVTPAPQVTTATGVHTAAFTPAKPGRHELTWTNNAGAVEVDVLDVWPARPRYLVSKAEAHERITKEGGGAALTAAQFEALPLYIAAATAVVEAEVGAIIPQSRTYSTVATHPRKAIVLPAHDVRVESVRIDGRAVEIAEHAIDDDAGIIYGDFLGKVVVEYMVGDNQVHPLARAACLEIIAHAWQSQRQSARTANRQVGDDQVLSSAGYYVPRRAFEMLERIKMHGGIA